jgi:uncharacterized protein
MIEPLERKRKRSPAERARKVVMTKLVLAATASLVALIVTSTVTFAQPVTGPAGHWEGAIEAPGQELKIEVDLAGAGDKWEGTITIPAQNVKGFPLSAIAVQGDRVSFAMKGVLGDPQFKGVISPDAKTLSGNFSQGGGTVPFALTRTGDAKIEPLPKSTPISKDLEGSWAGALDVDGKILRLAVKLSNQADGLATGTLVSIDQGGAEVPIDAVMQTGTHLKLVVRSIAGTYEGDLKSGELTGTWTQGPRTLPLIFKRPM